MFLDAGPASRARMEQFIFRSKRCSVRLTEPAAGRRPAAVAHSPASEPARAKEPEI